MSIIILLSFVGYGLTRPIFCFVILFYLQYIGRDAFDTRCFGVSV